jgi:hypothetical protein
MKLPVDTSAIAFLCAVEAEPVVDFETKRPRADENGEPLYMVQLIALSDGGGRDHRGQGARPARPWYPPGPPGPGAGAGRSALDDGRSLGRGVPCREGRAGGRPGQGQLATRREVEPERP